MPLRAFSLGIQFRCLEESCHIRYAAENQRLLDILVFRNVLESENYFLPWTT